MRASFSWCGSLTCADPGRASFAHLTIMSGCSAEPGRIKVTLMLSENPYANPNKVCGLSKPICSSSGHDAWKENKNITVTELSTVKSTDHRYGGLLPVSWGQRKTLKKFSTWSFLTKPNVKFKFWSHKVKLAWHGFSCLKSYPTCQCYWRRVDLREDGLPHAPP